MKKIAVFASGNGSNFQVIAEQFPVEFVFSDHRDAYVLERAEKLGVTAHAFELKEFDSKAAYEEAIVALLEKYDIGLVCWLYENCWTDFVKSLRRSYYQYSSSLSS